MASESNKEYSVNWKNHMSHVRKAFDNLLTSNELTDVTLCCEGKKIGAHKMLLSACSGYFRDTFKDVPCPHPVIFMFGVEYGVLSDILHFMYNGEVSVDTARLDMFLKTAQLLQISGLTDGANEKIIGENEAAPATQSSAIEQNVDETFTDSVAPASSASDEARKGVKRIKTREIDTANKVMRQEDDQVFLSDVKSEPCELVNFEDPLEDPLLQTDQPNDSKDFFGAPGQSIADEEFKHCSVSSDFEEEFATKASSSSDSSDNEDFGAKVPAIPEKSRSKYELTYERFEKWCQETNMDDETSETALMTYFEHKAKAYKPSSLWACYSMLRTVILTKRNVDISKHKRLMAFLKRKSTGYQAKKSKILTRQDVTRFLAEADDDKFLMMKVALIVGICGACHREELIKLPVENVRDEGQSIRLVIPNIRTKTLQEYFITSEDIEGADMVQIIRKYISLRPAYTSHTRFFVGYKEGRCIKQPVGRNTFAAMPKVIASFLKLPHPERYTGHCFRRSSSSLNVKRSRSWKNANLILL